MDNTVKNIKNLSLFGIIPVIFAIVFVGIYLERCGFKNMLLRNVFLVLLALLAVLAIILLFMNSKYDTVTQSHTDEQKGAKNDNSVKEGFVAQPTCG
jgi:uncharacterized membrane protein